MASNIILITNDAKCLPRSLILIHKIVSYTGLSNDTIYNGNNTSHLLMIFCKLYVTVFFKLTEKAQESKLPHIKLVNMFKRCLQPALFFLVVLRVQKEKPNQTPNSTSFSCLQGFSIDSSPNMLKDGLISVITVLQEVLLTLRNKSKEQSKEALAHWYATRKGSSQQELR